MAKKNLNQFNPDYTVSDGEILEDVFHAYNVPLGKAVHMLIDILKELEQKEREKESPAPNP